VNIIDCTQGDHEWFNARLGKVTASEVADAVRFLKRGDKKGEEGKTRLSYKAAIVSEILTGDPADTFVSKYMERGTELEPYARTAYEIKRNVMVEQVGFVIHPSIDRSGASPDGLVGEDGGLEIKCPKVENHLAYMLAGKLPPEYEPQVMWNLACTGRQWWDFVSYCPPPMPERHRLFIVRVHRDEQRIAELEAGVVQFLAEVDEMITALDTLNPEIAKTLNEQLRGSLGEDYGDLGITDEDIRACDPHYQGAKA